MTFADLTRIRTSWSGLTVLAFGSPSVSSYFLPSEAHRILLRTPNLIHCTIHLSFPSPQETPHLDTVSLSHLKSLTIKGDVPPRAFAEALHLPSLTHLYVVGAFGPPESEATSSIFLWIQRHGAQLNAVSVAHSSLTPAALGIALRNLPNVESLELAWNPASGPRRLNSTRIRGFDEVYLFRGLSPGNDGGCACPNLRVLSCKFFNGNSEETGKAIADFIEKRRSVRRPSSVVWLEKVEITSSIPLMRSIPQELKRRGVDTEGIWIPTADDSDDYDD
jgi:hypothetical protein